MTDLSVKELLSEATTRTGLADFGPEDFREGLEALVKGLNTDARISPARLPQLRERLLRLLMNRAWFALDLKQHPEILEEDLGTPTVISSLPRTASTKLHRMLGASGDFMTPLLWHCHMFARIPGEADGGIVRRIAETRAFEKWMYEVSPQMLTGHPVFTDEPEEDMILSEASFRTPFLTGLFDSDTYVGWLMQAEMAPTFDYLAMQLKYLQWQNRDHPPRPWLLKTPVHFGNEHWLQQIFGTLRVIVTHREPAKCIPSIASTTQGWRALYSEEQAENKAGAMMVSMFAHAASAHIQWRDDNPDIEVLDLSFNDVTRDGPGTAAKVYDFLGLALSEESRSAMAGWEARNGIEKHGKHTYSAENLGLNEQEIAQAFSEYRLRFKAFL